MRALLSVYDKSGVLELARGLADLGVELLSTGGTFAVIAGAGIPVVPVSDVTGFPEILDGRVKTLHPAIHAGLLARRDDPAHTAALAAHGFAPIDLLAVNLYPFAQTVAAPNVAEAAAVEQIDVGGPAMIRAAAKSFGGVVVLTDPGDYGAALAELGLGGVGLARRRALAAKAFAHVAAYDALIAAYLRREDPGFPDDWALAGRKASELRYGENPHQRAAAYRRSVPGPPTPGLLDANQLAGKPLSFNNLLDADAAWGALAGLTGPAVAIVKHTIPCGLATRNDLSEAFDAALAGDPVSAFGGIVALNRPVDEATAHALAAVFLEVVVAPGFSPEARAALAGKRQLRLLELPDRAGVAPAIPPVDVRPIAGGLLVQEPDTARDDPATWTTVSRRAPSSTEAADLRFAWHAARHVKSNAIVLTRDLAVVGVGSGQPNRLESVRIAAAKAGPRAAGAALASDAFFPFADGIEAAAATGVTAVVQPGGSVRDAVVIAAADAAGIAMLFTGVRHFRH